MQQVHSRIAVRELCEFAAKVGDLDLRFTPSPTSEEGIAGHQEIAARRGDSRRAEVRVSGTFGNVRVSGRADGYDAAAGVLEEVKTYKGDLALMPANKRALHWAQAKVYAALLCEELKLPALRVRLIYFDVGAHTETAFEIMASAPELQDFCADLVARFAAWSATELEHRQVRNQALSGLAFVGTGFRRGQRQLAENTFKAARLGRCLMAQAGTGIGKTLGTLYPLLKAMPLEPLDKIFFLTAKNSGHAAPLEAVTTLCAPTQAPLRVLQLVARDKACEHPDKACHGASCPLARGFYDRLPAARAEAAALADWRRDRVRAVALRHEVCPYYLTQELVRWADVVVADYNYYFDSSALLHGMTLVNEWRVAVLVDEAHNLLERARAMYSVEVGAATLRQAIRTAPAPIARALKKLRRARHACSKAQELPYASYREVPPKLASATRDACAAIADHLVDAPDGLDAPAMDLYFESLHFTRLAESFGEHSCFDITRTTGRGDTTMAIRNIVPAPFLTPRLTLARTVILFSATLTPAQFYLDTLGLPASTAWLEVEAPFTADQLDVRVVATVSTRFAGRGASALPIARIIAEQVRSRPGNYIAYLSSFEYLALVVQAFEVHAPEITVWRQERQMSDADKTHFLDHFVPGRGGVGFAVLGGSFAEGVDLPGERLIGAFIATLGLPQVNAVNEEMRRGMHSAFGAGWEYTYLYPGLRKVVQAAGRVIRTPSDRGTLFLIDERFKRGEVRALLPSWWAPRQHAGNRLIAPKS